MQLPFTRRTFIRIVIAFVVLALIGGGYFAYWYSQKDVRAEQTAAEQRIAERNAFFQNPAAKIIISKQTADPTNDRRSQYAVTVDTIVAGNEPNVAEAFDPSSGVISSPRLISSGVTTDEAVLQWYRIDRNSGEGGTLFVHRNDASELLTSISHVPSEREPAAGIGLVLSPDGMQLAWISAEASAEPVIVTYNVATQTESVIRTGVAGETWSDLAWSPTGTELAYMNNAKELVSFGLDGVEQFRPIQLSESELHNLQWIESDVFAGVLTTTSTNSKPFDPVLAVINRSGEIIERHAFADKIGIPFVQWDPTATYFTYYNPWVNQFIVSDRFNVIQAAFSGTPTGQVQPIAWLSGALPPRSTFDLGFLDGLLNDQSTSDEETPTVPAEPFTVTAEQWDAMNEATLQVVSKFAIDKPSYRFAVDATGVAIEVGLLPEQTKPAQTFLQILFQSAAELNDLVDSILPAVSLTVTLQNGMVFSADSITIAKMNEVLDTFSTKQLNDLFTDGQAVRKEGNRDQTYFGDLLYSTAGNYNPWPALAVLGVKYTETNIVNSPLLITPTGRSIALYYPTSGPTGWLVRDIGSEAGEPFIEGDTLLYTSATSFLSASSWEGPSIELRNYSIPDGLSLDNWLSIQRADRTYETATIDLQPGVEAKVFKTDMSQEYILLVNNHVYGMLLSDTKALQEADVATFESIITHFSDFTNFLR